MEVELEADSSESVEISKSHDYWRSLWVLIPINIYFWLKLYDYVDLYNWGLSNTDFLGMLNLSLGIPVYIASFLYIFCIKTPYRKAWQVCMILELGDCLKGTITNYSGLGDFIEFDLVVYPIYIIGLMYAFGLNPMWSNPKRWGRVTKKEYIENRATNS